MEGRKGLKDEREEGMRVGTGSSGIIEERVRRREIGREIGEHR